MCVIIEKLATKEVPYSSLLASATRNSDGYGVVIPQGDSIKISKGLSKSPEHAADTVAKLLDEAKNELAFAHFRLRTVGDLSFENAQPITLLKKSQGDECDLVMMHNGTINNLGKYGEGQSDSVLFANRVLEPLVRRSIAFSGIDNVLDDPLIGEILGYYGPMSKFALIDEVGNSLVVNRDRGVEREWGWASNSYSLDYEERKEEKSTGKVIYSSAWDSKIKKDIAFNKSLGRTSAVCTPPEIRMTVEDATGFTLDDFECLDEWQIRELQDEEPDLAALLILDLIWDRAQRRKTQKEAA